MNQEPPQSLDDERTRNASRRIIAGATGTLLAITATVAVGQAIQRDHNDQIAADAQATKVYESNLKDNQIAFATETADEQLKPDGTRGASEPEFLGSFSVPAGGNILDGAAPIIDNNANRVSPANVDFSNYTTQYSAKFAEGADNVVQAGEKFNVVDEDVNGDGEKEIIIEPSNLKESVADKVANDQKIAFEQKNKSS